MKDVAACGKEKHALHTKLSSEKLKENAPFQEYACRCNDAASRIRTIQPRFSVFDD
jgi:hypothetical protein